MLRLNPMSLQSVITIENAQLENEAKIKLCQCYTTLHYLVRLGEYTSTPSASGCPAMSQSMLW